MGGPAPTDIDSRPIEQRKDPLGRSHSRLKDRELVRQIPHRDDEPFRELDEEHQRPQREHVMDDPATTKPQQQADGCGTKPVHHGQEDGEEGSRMQVGSGVLLIDDIEIVSNPRTGVEHLNR